MFHRTLVGIVLTLTCETMLGLSIICGKLTTSANPFVFLIFRNIFVLGLCLPKVIFSGVPILGYPREKLSLMFNALAFGVTSLLVFVSIRYMPTGDATAIFSNYPVLGIFISKIFYKTKISLVEVICALASLVGVVFIAKPRFIFPQEDDDGNDDYWIGAVLAVCCLVTFAIATTATQGLKRTPSSVPTLHNAVYTIVLSYVVHVALVSPEIQIVDCGLHTVFILCSAFLFSGSLYTFQLALGFERITTLLPIRSMGVVVAYLLQVGILYEYPSWNSYVGASIIIASILTISIRRVSRERKKQTRAKAETMELVS